MKHWLVFLFLIVIIDPYSGLDYEAINVYIIDTEKEYSIKTYGPEPDKTETEFSDHEIDRFIRNAKRVINYSPYVIDHNTWLYNE